MTYDKKKRLLILGAGGHGAVVAECAQLMNKWSEISFLDSKWPIQKKIYEWDIIGKDDYYITKATQNDDFFVGIGNVKIRMKLIEEIKISGCNLVRIIHPRAIVSKHATILEGSLIVGGAMVNIGTSIASGCIINTGATIDHDCIIEEGAHICPGVNLGGNVSVGKKTWIGIGAKIINGITIGANSLIGAGAVVVNDIPDNVIAVGIPAKAVTRENKKC